MKTSILKRFFRDRRGVTAVEISLLSLPFFMLLMGIIESAMAFAGGVVLEGASAAAARLIRTGQVQSADNPEDVFRTKLCDSVGSFLDCDKISYEVIRVEPNTFAGAAAYEPQFDENGNLVSSGFSTGNSNDVVLIRTAYRYEFMTPFLGKLMVGADKNGSILHMATVVIKAEPYKFGEQ